MNTLIKAILFGAGGYLLWRTGILSSVSGGIIPSPVTGAAPPAGAAPAAAGPPAFNSLAVTGQRVQAAAILDYQHGDRSNLLSVTDGVPSASWDAWNYFLNAQTNFPDLPDYTTVSGQPNTGQALTFAQYWQLISPWLTKNKGMTGIQAWRGNDSSARPWGLNGWSGYDVAARPSSPSGLNGWVNSFYDRKTPHNLFYPNVRKWGF